MWLNVVPKVVPTKKKLEVEEDDDNEEIVYRDIYKKHRKLYFSFDFVIKKTIIVFDNNFSNVLVWLR